MEADRVEFETLCRYLIGSVPSDQFFERYQRGVAALALAPLEGIEQKAAANRWLLPFVDGALAAMAPDATLRRRLLLLSAILEAAPDHANLFLPTRLGGVALVIQALSLGLYALFLRIVGIPIVFFARRS